VTPGVDGELGGSWRQEVRAGEAGEEMPTAAAGVEEMDVSRENRDDSRKTNGSVVEMIGPHSHLPKSRAPSGVTGSPVDADIDEM